MKPQLFSFTAEGSAVFRGYVWATNAEEAEQAVLNGGLVRHHRPRCARRH